MTENSEKFPEKHDFEETINAIESAEQFDLNSLRVGDQLEFKTKHTTYVLEKREDGFYLSGNSKYCPEPTKVYISGSTMGTSAIKADHIVIGGYLELSLPDWQGPIATSEIQSFRKLN